jgi:hypothetical protein
MSGLSAGSSSGSLPSRGRFVWTLVRGTSPSPTDTPWTLVRIGVDSGEAQNAKNQRVARFIPWT